MSTTNTAVWAATLFVFWVVLNVWVLPYFGIQTCMSGACRTPRVQHEEPSSRMHNGVSDGESIRKVPRQ